MNYLKKYSDVLCGSYCLEYVLNTLLNLNLSIPKDLFWITDLGTYILSNTNINFDINCYNSNLYDDFLLLGTNSDFDGFISITNYLKKGGILKSDSISVKSLKDIINSENIIIVNVSSQTFNNDLTLNGGHFICLLEIIDDDKIKILNPKKEHANIELIPIETIINSIKDFGNWRINIKRSGI